jgi:hypothetical protein
VLDTVLQTLQPVLQPVADVAVPVALRGLRPTASRSVVIRHVTRLLGMAEIGL